jgi:hypothetical protein
MAASEVPIVANWEIVLALALGISFRSIEEALAGAIGPASAIVRFILAGLVSWAAVALLERMWTTYSNTARQRELSRYLEQRAARAKAAAEQRAAERAERERSESNA